MCILASRLASWIFCLNSFSSNAVLRSSDSRSWSKFDSVCLRNSPISLSLSAFLLFRSFFSSWSWSTRSFIRCSRASYLPSSEFCSCFFSCLCTIAARDCSCLSLEEISSSLYSLLSKFSSAFYSNSSCFWERA